MTDNAIKYSNLASSLQEFEIEKFIERPRDINVLCVHHSKPPAEVNREPLDPLSFKMKSAPATILPDTLSVVPETKKPPGIFFFKSKKVAKAGDAPLNPHVR